MKSLIDTIALHVTTHPPLVAFFGGRCTHGTASKNTGRPKLVYRVAGGDQPTRTTSSTQWEPIRVTFFAECETDDDANTAVDLLEQELRALPREMVGGGYIDNMTLRGSGVDEQDDQDNNNQAVWEGSLLVEFECGRDVR